MHDIKNYNTFIKIEPVNKGCSSDKKYYIETSEGRRLLLCVAVMAQKHLMYRKVQIRLDHHAQIYGV